MGISERWTLASYSPLGPNRVIAGRTLLRGERVEVVSVAKVESLRQQLRGAVGRHWLVYDAANDDAADAIVEVVDAKRVQVYLHDSHRWRIEGPYVPATTQGAVSPDISERRQKLRGYLRSTKAADLMQTIIDSTDPIWAEDEMVQDLVSLTDHPTGAVDPSEVERLCDAIERDRREPDKVLCHLQTLRRAVLDARPATPTGAVSAERWTIYPGETIEHEDGSITSIPTRVVPYPEGEPFEVVRAATPTGAVCDRCGVPSGARHDPFCKSVKR